MKNNIKFVEQILLLMRFIDKKEKLDYLLEIISSEKTGKADELSLRICVSRRTLLRYINDLKEMGYPIGYCLSRNTYYLLNEKGF